MNIPAEWTFKSKEIAEGFDAHVREQLPWYDLATEAVAHVVRHYLPEGGLVYDIGASTGNIGRSLTKVLEARNARLVAVEESAEMTKAYVGPGNVILARAQDMNWEPFDVGVLFLSLMFVPVADRQILLWKLCHRLRLGGALVVVDKLETPAGYIGTVMRRLTMSWKVSSGADPAAIVAKELSLGGVQRPIELRSLLPKGFEARPFFLFGEFAGWLVEARDVDPR